MGKLILRQIKRILKMGKESISSSTRSAAVNAIAIALIMLIATAFIAAAVGIDYTQKPVLTKYYTVTNTVTISPIQVGVSTLYYSSTYYTSTATRNVTIVSYYFCQSTGSSVQKYNATLMFLDQNSSIVPNINATLSNNNHTLSISAISSYEGIATFTGLVNGEYYYSYNAPLGGYFSGNGVLNVCNDNKNVNVSLTSTTG
jgi:hypothetical protein